MRNLNKKFRHSSDPDPAMEGIEQLCMKDQYLRESIESELMTLSHSLQTLSAQIRDQRAINQQQLPYAADRATVHPQQEGKYSQCSEDRLRVMEKTVTLAMMTAEVLASELERRQ